MNQKYIDHIRSVTPKSRLNRRRPKPRTGDIITALVAFVGVAGIMVIAYHISAK